MRPVNTVTLVIVVVLLIFFFTLTGCGGGQTDEEYCHQWIQDHPAPGFGLAGLVFWRSTVPQECVPFLGE